MNNDTKRTPQDFDTIANFEWMPGMLAMDEAGYTSRVVHVESYGLIYTEHDGGAPWALGIVAVDTSDPTTAACIAYLKNN